MGLLNSWLGYDTPGFLFVESHCGRTNDSWPAYLRQCTSQLWQQGAVCGTCIIPHRVENNVHSCVCARLNKMLQEHYFQHGCRNSISKGAYSCTIMSVPVAEKNVFVRSGRHHGE